MRVLRRSKTKRREDRLLIELGDGVLQIGHRTYGLDQIEFAFQRLYTLGVNRFLVHARAVVIPDQAVGGFWRRAGRIGGGVFQNSSQYIFGGFTRRPPLAPNRLRGRDRIFGPPSAVGKFVEILAGSDFSIEIADVNSVQRFVLSVEPGRANNCRQEKIRESHKTSILSELPRTRLPTKLKNINESKIADRGFDASTAKQS